MVLTTGMEDNNEASHAPPAVIHSLASRLAFREISPPCELKPASVKPAIKTRLARKRDFQIRVTSCVAALLATAAIIEFTLFSSTKLPHLVRINSSNLSGNPQPTANPKATSLNKTEDSPFGRDFVIRISLPFYRTIGTQTRISDTQYPEPPPSRVSLDSMLSNVHDHKR